MRPSAGAVERAAAAAAGGGSTPRSVAVPSSSSRCCSTTTLSLSTSSRISPPLLPSHPAPLCADRPAHSGRRAPGTLAAAAWPRGGAAAAPEPPLPDASALCRRASGPATQWRSSRSRSRRKNVVRARAASPSVSDASSSSSSPSPPSSSSPSQASAGGSRDVTASASASAVAAQSLGSPLSNRGDSSPSSSSSASSSSSWTASPDQELARDNNPFDVDDLSFDPLAPRHPLLLRWLRDAEAELRTLSFSLNFLAIGVAAAAAAGGAAAHSLDAAVAAAHAAAEAAEAAAHGGMHDPVTLDAVAIFSLPFGFGIGGDGTGPATLLSGASASALAAFLGAPWRQFASLAELHPLGAASAVSGAVYGLGDLTAQAYEGRGLRDLDAARLLRSAAVGSIAHGPLSAVFYERLDRFVILSDALGNGDAWFAPLFKVGVDQTLWAASWNALYLSLLGLMRLENPSAIRRAVAASGWDVLRAGWRLWPLVHLLTYTLVPLEARLLWVDAVDLGWVSVLAAYAAQRRGREEERQRRAKAGGRG